MGLIPTCSSASRKESLHGPPDAGHTRGQPGAESARQALYPAPDVSKPVKGWDRSASLFIGCPSTVPSQQRIDVQTPVTRVDGLVLSLCGRHLLAICGDKAIREFSVAERLATAHAPAAQPASADVEVRAVMRAHLMGNESLNNR